MTKYQYNALKNGKDVIKGEVEANSPREARDKIRQLGYTPLEIFNPNLIIEGKQDESDNQGGLTFMSLSDKILFVSELQVMVSSGISILEALQTIESHTPRIKIKRISHAIQGEIMKGRTFSQAINYLYHDMFGEVFIDLCVTGENTGELGRTFERMLTMLRKQDEIKSQILQALIYPCILIFMIFGILIFFAKIVFPRFMDFITTAGGTIPPFAQLVVDLLTFIGDYWLLCIIGIFGILGAIFFIATNEYTRGIIDRILNRIPLVKDFVNYVNLSNYMCIMSISYDCGVPFINTLSLAQKTISNQEIKAKASATARLIEKGAQYSEALEKTKLLPSALTTMIAAGEKAGNLSKMMQDCVDVIDKKVEMVMQSLTKAFEPAMIIAIGAIVLVIMIAFFQMYLGIISTL